MFLHKTVLTRATSFENNHTIHSFSDIPTWSYNLHTRRVLVSRGAGSKEQNGVQETEKSNKTRVWGGEKNM